MPHLVWTQNALRDLRRLYDFLKPESPEAARRASNAIRQAARALEKHAEIGRPVEDMLPGFRELVIEFGGSGYVALYHFDGSHIAMLAIRHGKEAGY